MYTPSQVLDAVLTQLDKLQVSGLGNLRIINDVVNNLVALKSAFDGVGKDKEEGAADDP